MAPPEPDSSSKGSEKRHEYVLSVPYLPGLSFAVWPIDDYTQREPLGKVLVRLKEGNIKAVKNLSGYHTFSGLPDDTYTLIVEPEHYFPREIPVSLKEGNIITVKKPFIKLEEPVIKIDLMPRPFYLFPDRATLLRGILVAENGLPAGITIKATTNENYKLISEVSDGEIQRISEKEWEFVLYFREPVKGKTESSEVIDREIQVILDEKGESVFYFRASDKGESKVTLEIKGEGVKETLRAEVENWHNSVLFKFYGFSTAGKIWWPICI